MLKNALHWQQLSSNLSLLLLILLTAPATAAESMLGVVKSPENSSQWSAITKRLQQVGIRYCVIDSADWKREADFGTANILLFPNVEKIKASQVQTLQQWMNKGGKVIVTGPTGNSSPPETQAHLRSLFGAFWETSLTSPATLELTEDTPVQWFGRTELSSKFVGGVLIPTSAESQTAAIWHDGEEKPAAIVTNNTTFLGWHWGSQNFTTDTLDSSWLQAALHRYGASTYGKLSPVSHIPPTACRPQPNELKKPRPITQSSSERPQSLRSRLNLDFYIEQPISRQEAHSMTQQLKGLIGRFETTLLTANARQSDISISTSEVIQKLLSRNTKNDKQPDNKNNVSDRQQPTKALKEARDGLKRFSYLVDRRNYNRARQQWSAVQKILLDNYPTEGKLAQSEVRAMWLDRGTIVKARSEADLAKIFDRMATAGINTVFFETVNSGYTIHPSRVAPQQNPLVKGWDPLRASVKLARERDMELHAWVWTFAAVNRRHNIILEQPRNYLGPVLARHPDWASADNTGSRFHYNSGKVFYDPAHPGVRRYLSELITEIATEYEVDGIHLDYVRYPFQDPADKITYGYGRASRQKFQQITGVDPVSLTPDDSLWSQWTKFRMHQVDSFIGEVSQELKQQRPELILSTAVFPMPRGERLYKIQQHWEEWVRQEWIDLLVPMTYAENTDKLNRLTSPLMSKFRKSNTLLLPGIRLLELSDVAAIDQVQLLRDMSTEGYALFAAENLKPSLENLFSRIQGNGEEEEKLPLPYRQPFETTLHRYRGLQKEWNFFLSNHQLSVEEMTLKEWGRKADRLAEDLEELAADPSNKNFLSTQLALSSFRRKFPQWMKETKSIDPYQARVWQNRLNTLDRLLSYGEKRILKGEKNSSVN